MKKISLISGLATGASLLMPLVAMAQGNLGNIEGLVQSLGNIVQLLLPIVFAIGLLVFFWGLAKYILAAGDPVKAKEGRSIMIWGVIALFIMAAIWGIVTFIGNALGVDQDETINAPGVGNL